MKKQRILAVAAIAAIFVLLVAAGGRDSGTAAGSTVPANFNATGLPIVKERIELKAITGKYAHHGDFNSMFLPEYVEKLTNIRIVVETVDGAAWNQRKNLIIAGGDLPDMFLTGFNQQEEVMYGAAGTFVALNPLIDKYAPFIQKFYKDFPAIKAESTTPDGNIYQLGQISGTGSGYWRNSDRAIINKTWVAEAGLNLPKTTDEFYNVLKAFKQKDSNRIPIIGRYRENATQNYIPAFLPWTTGYGWIYDRLDFIGDRVKYVPMEDAYPDYLAELARAYKEELLDKDFFTQTVAEVRAKGSARRVGVHVTGGSIVGEFGITDLKELENYTVVPPLTSKANSKPIWRAGNAFSYGRFFMTSANKNKEATIRLMDLFFDSENNFPLMRGPLWGEWAKYPQAGFQKQADGFLVNMPPTAYGIAAGEWRNGYVWPLDRVIGLDDAGKFIATQPTDKWLFDAIDTIYKPVNVNPAPALYFTEAQSERLAALAQDLGTYAMQFESRVITGDTSLNTFNEFRTQMRRMGVEEYLKLYTDAYNVYLKNRPK